MGFSALSLDDLRGVFGSPLDQELALDDARDISL